VPFKRPVGCGKQRTFLASYRWQTWAWIARKRRSCMLVGSWVFETPDVRRQNFFRKALIMAIKRVDASEVTANTSPVPSNLGSWGKRYPNLTERLYATMYEGGKRRTPSRLSLEFKNGMWVGTLVENDTGLMIQVEVESPDDLVPALEGVLAAPTQPWQHCPWAKPKSPGKSKK